MHLPITEDYLIIILLHLVKKVNRNIMIFLEYVEIYKLFKREMR